MVYVGLLLCVGSCAGWQQKMGGMAPQAQVWHELPKRKKGGKKKKKKRKEGGTKLPTPNNATK
jgi:hypothetical protein